MNTPPGQQPFAQYGATPPGNYTPPPRSNSGGCWKAAGITCGVLLLLGIIGIVVGVNWFKHSGLGGKIMQMTSTMSSGETIRQAVVKYHTQHGKYPSNLTQLVADGDIDGKILHSSLDPNPDPGHISWTYHQPTETSSPKTPLLTMHINLNIPGATPQNSSSDIVIKLDGTSNSDSGTSTGGHVETHTGSP